MYLQSTKLMLVGAMLFGLTLCRAPPADATPVANLAIVCEDVTANGKALDGCPGGKAIYRTPAATDLVRDCGVDATCWTTGDQWRAFSAVAVGSTYDTCKTSIEQNTRLPNPWTAAGDACKDWAARLKQITSTTGTINLSWDPVLLCTDSTDGIDKACNDPAHPLWAIAGYRVLSGVTPGALTLLRATAADVTALVLPGYGNGDYYFQVQAFNADPESPDGLLTLPPLLVRVDKPLQPQAHARPAASAGMRATVTYP